MPNTPKVALQLNGRELTKESCTLQKAGIRTNETLTVSLPLIGGSYKRRSTVTLGLSGVEEIEQRVFYDFGNHQPAGGMERKILG